jgi:hypothetical protein
LFESEKPEVYEKVYQGLVERLAGNNFSEAADGLGLTMSDDKVLVPCLGRQYLVGAKGVTMADGGEAPLNHRIVLAYYIMHGGRGETAGRWVLYRELPGGQDFARALSQMVEGRLAAKFGGRAAELKQAALDLGGQEAESPAACDLALAFEALPRLPLLVTFYDQDEEFPAEAKVFYDLTAPNFLDLECLAVLGLLLVQEIEGRAEAA